MYAVCLMKLIEIVFVYDFHNCRDCLLANLHNFKIKMLWFSLLISSPRFSHIASRLLVERGRSSLSSSFMLLRGKAVPVMTMKDAYYLK